MVATKYFFNTKKQIMNKFKSLALMAAIALFSNQCLPSPCKASLRSINREFVKPTPTSELEVIEDISHEPGEAPNAGTIIFGNHNAEAQHNTGAKILTEDLGNIVRVRIDIAVLGEVFHGRPGKFKAIYRLRWKV